MKATRDGFGDQLVKSAKNNENIIALSADLCKATKLSQFAEKYPERFFECGIAENNMIGIASGLANNGFKVFLASFAAFLTGKYDTIRCSIAYSNEPCILVGSHGGMAIGKDGVTQMGLEDISIMRSLPNMVILNPATYIEAQEITKYLCESKLKNPHYLRIGRQPVEEVFDENYKFNIEEGQFLQHSTGNIVVLSTGCILPNVLEATKDMFVTVINIPVIKPLPHKFIKEYVMRYHYIFTVEDHSIIGGLGSSIAEILAESVCDSILIRIGLNDIFPESGPPDELYEKYGLSSKKIKEKISNIYEFYK